MDFRAPHTTLNAGSPHTLSWLHEVSHKHFSYLASHRAAPAPPDAPDRGSHREAGRQGGHRGSHREAGRQGGHREGGRPQGGREATGGATGRQGGHRGSHREAGRQGGHREGG